MINLNWLHCKQTTVKNNLVTLNGLPEDQLKEIIDQLKNQVSIDEILDLFDKEAIEQYLAESKG